MKMLDALQAKPTVLILEDEQTQRHILRMQLEREGYTVLLAENGQLGMSIYRDNPGIRIVITDLMMPQMDGFEVVQTIRKEENHYTYIIVLTSLDDRESLLKALTLGADDYLHKPVIKEELFLRLQGAARLIRLEGQDELIFALAEMTAYRSGETGQHLSRVREYCSILADDIRKENPEQKLTKSMVNEISSVSVLHDIGKVGIPDKILHKPGRLTHDEFEVMKKHTTMGGKILMELYQKNGSNYLLLGHEIAIAHHEKWNGKGYPNGLQEEQIPIAARIMALADVFDALTSSRCYKDIYSFERAKSLIVEDEGTHFDKMVVQSYLRKEQEMQAVQKKFQTDKQLQEK